MKVSDGKIVVTSTERRALEVYPERLFEHSVGPKMERLVRPRAELLDGPDVSRSLSSRDARQLQLAIAQIDVTERAQRILDDAEETLGVDGLRILIMVAKERLRTRQDGLVDDMLAQLHHDR